MCDHTYGYEPAHPQFWQNSQPNAEKTENPQKFKYFKKKMEHEQKNPKQITQWSIK